MLRFFLTENSSEKPWITEGCRWSCGQSFIEPFDHIALEYFAFEGDSRMTFIVRERLNGYSTSIKPPFPPIIDIYSKNASDIISEMEEWPLHFMIINLSYESDFLNVSIKNSSWPTAPVFLTASRLGLWGDWDPIKLYPHLASKNIDETRLAFFLTAFETPYSSKTLFSDMYMITERATAHWKSNNNSTFIQIDYPSTIKSPIKRTLKPDADVLDVFEKIMSQSVNRWLTSEVHVVSELSSGLDSGVVSAICSLTSKKKVDTCGIIVPGEEGVLQQARRAEMIEIFNYKDHKLDAENHPPLATESIRVKNDILIPWEECYYEITDELLLTCIQPGKTIMFTGVGGDELFFPHWDELDSVDKEEMLREITIEDLNVPKFINDKVIQTYLNSQKSIDRAPRSLIPTSSLEGCAYGDALYLRRGVWPIYPFCTPEVIRFCRSLPEFWRKNRMLERKFLSEKGCSDNVSFPKSTESFNPFMENSLREDSKVTIGRSMRNSILNHKGCIDSELFLQHYNEYCEGNRIKEAPVFYYATAIMEMSLQCAETKIMA